MEPADRADLREDDLLLDVLERAELADDLGRLLGQDAPDGREVEVDQEAVVGGELDPLARHVDRVGSRRLAQAVAPRVGLVVAGAAVRRRRGLVGLTIRVVSV